MRKPAGVEMQVPSNEKLQGFVQQVREACPGGWPINATGGYVAAGWESSNGVFVVVENPMDTKGVIHTPRKGSVPHRLPDGDVTVRKEFVTFRLDWPQGDSRLFWIAVPPAPPAGH